jgi:glucan phosphoethanolaminetransferase (alkaline phosphatase superfamily)
MTILLPTLAVAFAAFCVWLTVRIVNRRERWAKRTAVVTAAILTICYPGSVVAIVWLDERYRCFRANHFVFTYCAPYRWLYQHGPDWVRHLEEWITLTAQQ